MKIAIIISSNTFKSHLNYYFNFLDQHNIEYDVICWNRRMIDEPGAYAYNFSQDESKGYFYRFYSYLGYKKFVIDCLKRNCYDRIIISTIAIAILLYPYLKKHYRNKYLFDIRDYSLILYFTWFILNKVIDNSSATVISSPGFKNWLPKSSKYYIAHNFPFEQTNGIVKFITEEQRFSQNSELFEIATIGSLRDFEANKVIIDAFQGGNEFKLNFIGTGPAYDSIKNHVMRNDISNTFFYGFYHKEDEFELLETSDIINNFTNTDLNSRTLLTNRFYLSVVLGIPMIVRFGTYQAELCERYNLGCVLDPHKDIKDQFINFTTTFKYNEYMKGCKDFLKVVENDTKNLDIYLLDFVLKC
jgi:hypothetical protein